VNSYRYFTKSDHPSGYPKSIGFPDSAATVFVCPQVDSTDQFTKLGSILFAGLAGS